MGSGIKWNRYSGGEKIVDAAMEYSTGHIDRHHYISVSHAPWSNHYWYTYFVFEKEVLKGSFDANSLDEAEDLITLSIRNELMDKAAYWKRLYTEFDNAIEGEVEEMEICPSCGEELNLRDAEDDGYGELKMYWECEACGRCGYAVIDQHNNNEFIGHMVIDQKGNTE